MGLLTWILVGAVSGWLASRLISGSGKGLVRNTLLGVAGALLGGFLADAALGVDDAVSGFDAGTIATSVVGAAALLIVGGAWRGGDRRRR